MTVDERLSQGAVLVQDAWASLADTWAQSVQELLHSLTADPFGLFHPDVVADQMFDLARRSFEINMNLVTDLAGASDSEPAVEHNTEPVTGPLALPPVEVIHIPAPAALAPKPARPLAADRYRRLTKADLQKTLSSRHLPKTGTVKELRQRLIEADRTAAG